jgi:hypothetical protein
MLQEKLPSEEPLAVLDVGSVTSSRGIGEHTPTAAPTRDAGAEGRLPRDRVTLSPEARQQLRELQERDAHVRQHEAAHQAAGGDVTGAASFTYRTGPDGRSYAVGGEVQVVAHPGRTPEETVAIARRVRAAALAPADPSSADLDAAAQAARLEQQAEQQRRQQASAPALPGAAPDRAAPRPGAPVGLERLVVRSPEPAPIF